MLLLAKLAAGPPDASDLQDEKVSPVDLGKPSATCETRGAMIYRFKKMIGNHADDDINSTLLVPRLCGLKGGPTPCWATLDWDLAWQGGAGLFR